jgi:hypothetical protein
VAVRAPFTQPRRVRKQGTGCARLQLLYIPTVQLQPSACSRTHNLSVCTPPLLLTHAVAQRGQRQPAGSERLAT